MSAVAEHEKSGTSAVSGAAADQPGARPKVRLRPLLLLLPYLARYRIRVAL